MSLASDSSPAPDASASDVQQLSQPSSASASAAPASDAPSLAKVRLKLLPYWPSDPQLWFVQAEAQFANNNITSPKGRYNVVVASLAPEFAAKIRDLLISPPQHDPYNTLKAALIQRTHKSEQARLRELLSTADVGDRQPSIVNFYHRFQQNLAASIAPLHALLGGRPKTQSTLMWTDAASTAFNDVKDALADAVTLHHPSPYAPYSLMVVASDLAVGAVLQQHTNNERLPVSFFSRKLKPTETRYSTFCRELLAIYLAIKHFRHFLEGRQFHICTDHKPLTYAIRNRSQNHSPRQLRHLSFIAEFTTDRRNVPGKQNAVADALSRCELPDTTVASVSTDIDWSQLATAQATDQELRTLQASQSSSLVWKVMHLPTVPQPVTCDICTGSVRPYMPAEFRRTVFDIIHRLSHPGIHTTRRLLTARNVWPSMNKDIALWCRTCLACQRSKVHRHTSFPTGHFRAPDARFSHVHIDIIGPLPISNDSTYLLTMVDRFTRWPEAVPIPEISAETVARHFVSTSVARFGTPSVVTTDRGSQFESSLFFALTRMLGIHRTRTTAYHPAANGMV